MADQKYNILLTAADETKAAFESANRNIEKMTGGLVSLQGLMAGVSVGALVDVVKTSADAADEMGKAAQKVGTTTEALSQLKYAAELSNVPFDALEKGLEKISKAAYDATTVGGALAKSFEQMGISTTDSNGKLKDSSVLMSEVADKFSHMQDGSAKTALAMSLFGKAGADMIPMLNEGSAGLKEMADQADKLGVTISSNTAAEANRFEDNLTRLHAAGTGMANQLTAALLPALNEVTQAFVDGAHDGQTLAVVTDTVKTAFEAVVILGANVAFTFHQIGEDIGGIAAQAAALAHGDFSGFKRIGEEMKAQAAAANKELDDFDNRILHPPTPPAIEQRSGFAPTIDDTKAIASLDKLLAASKAFDEQSTVAHEDAFNKWLTKWKEIEDQLTAEGTKGNQARMAHEAAYTTYVNAENEKRLADAQKAESAKAAQLQTALKTENDYFAKLGAMSKLADKSALGAEQQRYQDQVQQFQDKYDLAVNNHTLSLAEEEGFQQAFTDIERAHAQQQQQIGEANALQQLSVAGTKYRALFELNKEVRTAEAIVDGWGAVQAAFKFGSSWGGPVGGAAMAAIAAAAAAANVAAIQGASFGGGKGLNGAGGGSGGAPLATPSPLAPVSTSLQSTTAAAPAATPAAAPQQVNITLVGDSNTAISYDQVVNQLIPAINQAAGNGVNINVKMVTA